MSGARRFGGPHSPNAQGAAQGAASPRAGAQVSPARGGWAGRRAASVSLRALGLFLFPTPLLIAAVVALTAGDAARMAGLLGAFAALILGAGLTRTGLAAADAYEARAVAKPPAFPRKLFGAAFTALGVGASALLGGAAPASALIFAGLAALLHVVAFGPDPMRAKGVDGLSGAALDDAVTRIDIARALIADMTRAADSLGDRALSGRVRALADSAAAVIARLEQNPGEMRRARRFLAVYLVGARDATVKFAQAEKPDAAAYGALLDDLETHFARHRETLMVESAADLDVEIAVLRDRLKMEGV